MDWKKLIDEAEPRVPGLDLTKLPLISTLRFLLWTGRADGNPLTPAFPISDIEKKYVVIKSIQLIPYCEGNYIDFFITDGVTPQAETIPGFARINRIFDTYNTSAIIKSTINGAQVPFFNVQGNPGYPIDFYADNLLYAFDQRIQTWGWSVLGDVFNDIQAQTTDQPLMKVVVGCYLI